MTREIPESHPLHRLFRGLTESTFMDELGIGDPGLVGYVADLLARFVPSQDVWRVRDGQGRRLDRGRRDGRRGRVGPRRRPPPRVLSPRRRLHPVLDRRLSRGPRQAPLAGLGRPPDRLPGPGEAVVSTSPAPSAAEEAPVLRRLSDEFELCAFGLSRVRREWERHDAQPPRGPIRGVIADRRIEPEGSSRASGGGSDADFRAHDRETAGRDWFTLGRPRPSTMAGRAPRGPRGPHDRERQRDRPTTFHRLDDLRRLAAGLAAGVGVGPGPGLGAGARNCSGSMRRVPRLTASPRSRPGSTGSIAGKSTRSPRAGPTPSTPARRSSTARTGWPRWSWRRRPGSPPRRRGTSGSGSSGSRTSARPARPPRSRPTWPSGRSSPRSPGPARRWTVAVPMPEGLPGGLRLGPRRCRPARPRLARRPGRPGPRLWPGRRLGDPGPGRRRAGAADDVPGPRRRLVRRATAEGPAGSRPVPWDARRRERPRARASRSTPPPRPASGAGPTAWASPGRTPTGS